MKQKELSNDNRRNIVKHKQLYNRVYRCVFAYELCLGNFSAVLFIFIVFIRGFIVNKVQTQQ